MTGVPIGKEAEFWIKFDVEHNGKSLSGVRIKICRAMEKNMAAGFDVSLASHPLYPALVEYVKNNPLEQKT